MSVLTRVKARRQPKQRDLFPEPAMPKPHKAKAARFVPPADPNWIFAFVAPTEVEWAEYLQQRSAR